MEAPCGGTGTCKCKVRLKSKFPSCRRKPDRFFFNAEQIADGWRLACLYKVNTDIYVDLPPQSSVSNIVSQGYMKNFVHAPYARKVLNTGNADLHLGNNIEAVNVANSTASCCGVAIDLGTIRLSLL